MIYSLLIHIYALLVRLVAPFHRKARLMCEGQRKTSDILRSRIDPEARYIWFHAASLGEFEQGRPLMEKLKKQYPDYRILLTFFSPSGYEVRKQYKGADVICYLPFDTPSRVREFLDLARPAMAVFIKYEFWGNYLRELKKRSVPTYIISAIFRPEQVFFRWYGASYRKVLYCFDHLYVQDETSEALLQKYGITRVSVTGDTRYDRVHDISLSARAVPEIETLVHTSCGEKVKTLVAGSSWPQDEALLLPYFNERTDMKLIIAPHEIHESHLQAIESMLKRPFIRLSQASGKNLSEYDCLIIDCFGLLSSVYRYGEVAYIGGGFGAGIHNTLEAAVYGVPVLFGPKYGKFKEACDLIAAGGAFSVTGFSDFKDIIDNLWADEVVLKTAGAASSGVVRKNLGATDVILKDWNL